MWLVGANFESSRLELDDSIGCEIEASRQKFSHTMPKRAPKRARDDVVKKNEEAPAAANSLMTALMRRGSVSVLEALEVELPEVLKTEVIAKHLPLDDTLELAQVSKWCRDAVWSPETLRNFYAEKIPVIG